jgi:hypothetical protein
VSEVRRDGGAEVKPTAEQNLNLALSVARVRLDIIDQLHSTYGAELSKLRARLADREKRIRAARAQVDWFALNPGRDHAGALVRALNQLLDLRRPLRKGKR